MSLRWIRPACVLQWEDGQSLSKCKAAQVDHGGGDRCWYDDRRYNTTFASYCDRAQCSCAAIEMAMGREVRPNVWQLLNRLKHPALF